MNERNIIQEQISEEIALKMLRIGRAYGGIEGCNYTTTIKAWKQAGFIKEHEG